MAYPLWLYDCTISKRNVGADRSRADDTSGLEVPWRNLPRYSKHVRCIHPYTLRINGLTWRTDFIGFFEAVPKTGYCISEKSWTYSIKLRVKINGESIIFSHIKVIIQSVPKFTANLYCICLSIDLRYT